MENKKPLKRDQIASSNFMQFPPPIKTNFESLSLNSKISGVKSTIIQSPQEYKIRLPQQNRFRNQFHQQKFKSREDPESTSESEYFREANPFTGYLAKVFLQLKESQEIPDTEQIRAIQMKTIKDLEDCLADYEKTENALNELQVMYHGMKNQSMQFNQNKIIKKHLQVNE